jgi:Fanconi anemia group M protein
MKEGKVLKKEKFVEHEELRDGSVETRQYQIKILNAVRKKNTLVVLPTALGKTVIALLLVIEKVKKGKVYFLAPTKPLVQQHYQIFLKKTLFEEKQIILVTGKYPPEKRESLYKMGKIVFATPQCIYNDVKNNRLTLEDASLIVFDEAHRSRGNYAYVGIAKYYFRQSMRPLVLGLTASPGGYEEKIAEVCKNLRIEAIEYRTDEDEDVIQYIQPINVEWKRIKLSDSYLEVRDKLKEMINEKIKKIQSLGELTKKPLKAIMRRDLVELNEELLRRIKAGEGGYLYQLKVISTATLSLMHMTELIETQGPETLTAFIEKSLKRMAFNGSRGHKLIINDPIFFQVNQKLLQLSGLEYPKITELKTILSEEIKLKTTSRFIVFTQYRDTVVAILKALRKTTGIKGERFVGQGEREGDRGMKQEEQQVTLNRLRNGETNLIVATSIAEEGLDIPEVDHVIFYEPVPSEIRYIQRRGRTGRKVAGKVTILIAEDTRDEAFYWISIKKTKKMKRLISQLNKKLPKMLKKNTLRFEQIKLSNLTSKKREEKKKEIKTEDTQEKIQKLKLWTPKILNKKGLRQALNWLSENLPTKLTTITELVEKGIEETKIKRQIMETAIWELIKQGQLYQPQPGKIKKI